MNLLAGGGTIDSNGYSIGITGCGFSGSGILTKTGLGVLTLNGASSYDGGTVTGNFIMTGGNYDAWIDSTGFLQFKREPIPIPEPGTAIFLITAILPVLVTRKRNRKPRVFGFQQVTMTELAVHRRVAAAGSV